VPAPPAPLPQAGEGSKPWGCLADGCLPSPIYGRGAGERASASRRDGLDLNRRALSPSRSPAGGRGEQTVGGLFCLWLSPVSHLWERGGGEGERLKTRWPRFEPPCPLPQPLSRRRERGADRGAVFACGCLPSPIYGRGAGERASASRRDGLDLNRRALSPSPSPAGGRGEQTVGGCFACGCLPSPIYGRGAGERASASRRDGLDLNRRARSPSPSPAGGRGEQTVGRLFCLWFVVVKFFQTGIRVVCWNLSSYSVGDV